MKLPESRLPSLPSFKFWKIWKKCRGWGQAILSVTHRVGPKATSLESTGRVKEPQLGFCSWADGRRQLAPCRLCRCRLHSVRTSGLQHIIDFWGLMMASTMILASAPFWILWSFKQRSFVNCFNPSFEFSRRKGGAVDLMGISKFIRGRGHRRFRGKGNMRSSGYCKEPWLINWPQRAQAQVWALGLSTREARGALAPWDSGMWEQRGLFCWLAKAAGREGDTKVQRKWPALAFLCWVWRCKVHLSCLPPCQWLTVTLSNLPRWARSWPLPGLSFFQLCCFGCWLLDSISGRLAKNGLWPLFARLVKISLVLWAHSSQGGLDL